MQKRTQIPFKSNGETLMGYLYKVENPHGILICAHGINNLADGNSAQYENYFINNGWDVFTIDMTGCGLSSGKGMKTLHESKYCVQNAIKTVKNYAETKNLPICLMGHSWGGYGVVTASDRSDVKAVVSFSGYESAADMMYGFAENNTSSIVALTKPGLDLALTTYYGNEPYVTCSDVIKRNQDINYVVVQGDEDDIVNLKRYSTYDHVYKSNQSNITPILLEGVGHPSPWKNKNADAYYASYIEPGLKALHDLYGNTIPEDKLSEFVSTVDKEKSSEVDLDLLNRINNVLLKSIS